LNKNLKVHHAGKMWIIILLDVVKTNEEYPVEPQATAKGR